MKCAVVTAIFGDYDEPKLHPDIDGVDWFLVTDRERDVPGWQVIVEAPGHDVHPRLIAKVPKFMPWLYAPGYDRWLWVDASAAVVSADLVTWAFTYDGDAGMYAHPWRNDIGAEADVSAGMAKYAGLPVQRQAATYKADGLPTPSGLFATGVIAWHDTPKAKELAARWIVENCFWTYQDQLSLPMCIHQTGARVVALDGHLTDGVHVAWHQHHHEG